MTTISIDGTNNDTNLILNSQSGSIVEGSSNVVSLEPSTLVNTLTSANKVAMQAHIDALISDGTKNMQVVYGNAFTGEEEHLVAGKQADGTDLTTDNYMRWMSMTKLLGGLVCMKMCEEGIVGIDDPIKNYIPEFAKENLSVLAYTLPYDDVSFATHGDISGTTACITDITIRHLLQMKAGYSYGIWIDAGYVAYQKGPNREQYVRDNYPNVFLDGIDGIINGSTGEGNVDFTNDDWINSILGMPLVHQPGTESTYGVEYSILGAVLSKALAAKGLFDGNAAKYTKAKFFDPMGMTSVWLGQGQLQPPTDAVTKLVDTSLKRSNDASGNLKGGGTADPNYDVSVNTGVAGAVGPSVFTKDIPGDTYNKLDNSYLKNEVVLTYAGNFGWGGAGSLVDYCKLLKLIINKGVHNGTRIMGAQIMEYFCQHTTTAEEPMDIIYGFGPQLERRWGMGFTKELADGDATNVYPFGPGYMTWVGYYGTKWELDLGSGHYCVSGIQSIDAVASGSRGEDLLNKSSRFL